jgi:hypothetical protein
VPQSGGSARFTCSGAPPGAVSLKSHHYLVASSFMVLWQLNEASGRLNTPHKTAFTVQRNHPADLDASFAPGRSIAHVQRCSTC